MPITSDQIKELRELCGVSLQSCKQALEEAKGDMKKAVEVLRKKGEAKAIERMGRTTGAGSIFSYIHSNGKIGVLVELGCETDFVAKTEGFQTLGKDLAMHIAAMNPLTVRPEDIDASLIQAEHIIWKEELKRDKKPQAAWPKILEGKEKKFREEHALLTQPFVKQTDITVGERLIQTVQTLGEHVQVKRFVRYG